MSPTSLNEASAPNGAIDTKLTTAEIVEDEEHASSNAELLTEGKEPLSKKGQKKVCLCSKLSDVQPIFCPSRRLPLL